ncbi:MAG: hypothetical protein O8C66_13935 [Candidatus Methanoperedens sp.]|nr:hypothetical protein [Candidatus Methanoperedens sp.]MCZ7371599.1 hypothetical protein [Candidatus Methanoperedens sp.]
MDKSNDCSRTVRIVGTALVITPIIAAIPNFLMAIFSGGTYPGPDRPDLSQEYVVASGLLITAGFILILYGSVEKFKEGYQESIGKITEPGLRSNDEDRK